MAPEAGWRRAAGSLLLHSAAMPDSRVELLLENLAQAFERKAWHGTNLLGSVRGLDPERAAFRPAPGRHNIWELVVHAAYWKYAVWRLLVGAARGSFPEKGSNWFRRPVEATAGALREDVALLKQCHRQLVTAVAAFDPERLDQRVPSGRWTFRESILGAASHDLYHAGQIQLLKRLFRSHGRTVSMPRRKTSSR